MAEVIGDVELVEMNESGRELNEATETYNESNNLLSDTELAAKAAKDVKIKGQLDLLKEKVSEYARRSAEKLNSHLDVIQKTLSKVGMNQKEIEMMPIGGKAHTKFIENTQILADKVSEVQSKFGEGGKPLEDSPKTKSFIEKHWSDAGYTAKAFGILNLLGMIFGAGVAPAIFKGKTTFANKNLKDVIGKVTGCMQINLTTGEIKNLLNGRASSDFGKCTDITNDASPEKKGPLCGDDKTACVNSYGVCAALPSDPGTYVTPACGDVSTLYILLEYLAQNTDVWAPPENNMLLLGKIAVTILVLLAFIISIIYAISKKY